MNYKMKCELGRYDFREKSLLEKVAEIIKRNIIKWQAIIK